MTTNLISRPLAIPSYLYNQLTNLITFLFTILLPSRLQTHLLFYRDLLISLLYLMFGRFLPPLSHPHADLTGKTAIVTGANSGIGLQIATDLARQGCTVYLACRSKLKAEAAVNTIVWRLPGAKGRVLYLELDTSDLGSVRDCALLWSGISGSAGKDGRAKGGEKGRRREIDILVHNAGIPEVEDGGKGMNGEGVEMVYATNFLGGFLLTYFLEPFFSQEVRVILTSSTGQYFGGVSREFSRGPVRGVECEGGFHVPEIKLGGWEVVRDSSVGRYANSKFMQVVFAKMLQERFDRIAEEREGEGDGDGNGLRRTAHAFAPGFVYTPIFTKWRTDGVVREVFDFVMNLISVFSIDVEQGAATGSWLAMTNQHQVVGKGNGGGYWDRMQRMSSMAEVMDRRTMDRLWTRWERDAGVEWK